MKARFTLLIALSTTACTSMGHRPEAEVSFQNQLSPEEAARHEFVGDVVTAEPSEFDGDEAAARAQIQGYAYRRGADLVVMERTERFPCELNPELSCIYLKGRAYRKLTDTEIAAAAAASKAASDAVTSTSAAPAPAKKAKRRHKPASETGPASSSAVPRK